MTVTFNINAEKNKNTFLQLVDMKCAEMSLLLSNLNFERILSNMTQQVKQHRPRYNTSNKLCIIEFFYALKNLNAQWLQYVCCFIEPPIQRITRLLVSSSTNGSYKRHTHYTGKNNIISSNTQKQHSTCIKSHMTENSHLKIPSRSLDLYILCACNEHLSLLWQHCVVWEYFL